MDLATNPLGHQLLLTFVASMLESYAKALSAVKRRQRWSTAMVGSFDQVMWVNEGIRDVGITIDAAILPAAENIHLRTVQLEALNTGDFDLFILGGRTPQEELQILQRLLSRFSDNAGTLPPIYLCQKIINGTIEAFARLPELRTCLNPKKLAFVSQLLACSPRTGAVAECGVYRGGTTVFMGKLLDAWNDPRQILAFDTFEGMPTPTAKDGQTVYQAGLFTESPLEMFQQYVFANGLGGRITPHKGLIQDTLPVALKADQRISFALVDTDQYAGTIASLKTIVPLLEKNGVIIIDDYDLVGVKEAVAEASALFPTLRGADLTFNFYMLWNTVDQSFLSSYQR